MDNTSYHSTLFRRTQRLKAKGYLATHINIFNVLRLEKLEDRRRYRLDGKSALTITTVVGRRLQTAVRSLRNCRIVNSKSRRRLRCTDPELAIELSADSDSCLDLFKRDVTSTLQHRRDSSTSPLINTRRQLGLDAVFTQQHTRHYTRYVCFPSLRLSESCFIYITSP
ncbi:hypothetical protein J6590_086105 [Homalodisca vitripennis]|nr:hypothetical protein J6590_086105 [Homalodisca vitripennis]